MESICYMPLAHLMHYEWRHMSLISLVALNLYVQNNTDHTLQTAHIILASDFYLSL